LASDQTKDAEEPKPEASLCSVPPQGVNMQLMTQSPLMGQANSTQRDALQQALNRRLTLVQGPPGSGKTHCANLLIRLWLSGQRGPILATADSNVAVDNLLAGCAKAGLEAVRVGRPENVRPDLEKYNLLEKAKFSSMMGEAMAGFFGGNYDSNLWSEEKRVISNAQVVCCTCSGAEHPVLQGMEFSSIIIDEAGQATEPSVLVPLLRLQAARGSTVLIGDHRQLPPTVVDPTCESEGLGVSLFGRLAARGVQPVMLDVQYRMHPVIAQFPSRRFYGSRLRTGVCGQKRPAPQGLDWPDRSTPVCFVPINGAEARDGSSFTNIQEATAIESLLAKALAAEDLKVEDVGIISPYAAQVRLLRRQLNASPMLARLGCRVAKPGEIGLEVSSVDGYQGREKDLIIVSTVRANPHGKVGFLADERRLNVTITRARRGLVVCGNLPTLMQDGTGWQPWIQWAQERGLVAGFPATDPQAASSLNKLSQMPEEMLLAGNV